MTTPFRPLERFIRRFAIAVAFLVWLALPLGTGLLSYRELVNDLDFKAFVKASALNKLVADLPDVWMYAENRVNGIIACEPVPLVDEEVRVYDAAGQIITAVGPGMPVAPIIRNSAIYDGWRKVGSVMVSRSAWSLMNEIGIAVLVGTFLSTLVLLGLQVVPLRVLRQIADELFQSEERAGITLSAMHDAVVLADCNNRTIYINPAAERMLGRLSKEAQGQPLSEVVKFRQTTDADEAREDTCAVMLSDTEPGSKNGQGTLIGAYGRKIVVEAQTTPMYDRVGQFAGVVLCLHDVTQMQQLIDRHSWEATHDPLTGLFNRREFTKRVQDAIVDASVSLNTHVVLYMDLDRFKIVNDTCGHAAGDRLLKELCALIQTRLRDADVFGRLGGDEFGLLLLGCNQVHGQTIAADIKAALSAHLFDWEGRSFRVGISIGLGLITQQCESVDDVLNTADSACYRMKRRRVGERKIEDSAGPACSPSLPE